MMNFQSLKFRIIALGVTLVVLGIGLRLVFALPFAQDQLRDLAASQQLSIASYIAHDIDHSIVARQTLIGELAGILPPALVRRPDELTAWLKERERLNPLFNGGLLVIHPDGNGTLASYPAATGREDLDFSGREWFQAALKADAPVMSRPQREQAGGDPIIIMAAPVRDASMRVVAVLAGVASLDAPGFLDRLQENQLGATGGFLLISPADKLFVGASDPSMILKPTPPQGVNLLHDRAMAGYRGVGVTVNAEGVEELSAMASVPSTGWFVVARMPTAEAFRPIAALRGFWLKSTLLVLVVTLAILLFMLPRILRPLTEAAQAMREMADGEFELRPLPVRRNDEVGSLALGFNYLVARLREKEAALRASQDRMEFMAHHDALTGLFNRPMLEDRLQQAVARAEHNGTRFALLFCDLDGFKPVNDRYGHNVGDAVLVQVATRFSEGRRQIDTVARLGGDEFVILLADLDDAHLDAVSVARHYLATIGAPYDVGGITFTLSISIGIALPQGPSLSGSQILSQADMAMYQAKRAGKNQFCLFDEETGDCVAEPSSAAQALDVPTRAA
ncbi:diguanylate cyclase/phosphodiesterase (GGDEF & EAL domains) with PAS/PAC sensor [Collimonas arenae]|uniref:Diguanylate cyclase/phosphodiesterase (GGDEF & EAL domains) with PAS/PAC sensor n=1 Tax=Collimonas arenae TaxID=279058 RepID=A0A0A1FFL2_9BURK|nr:diguanylate cyclase [Collimonas arenae]AIY41637.1 diguanylate cyclase/phosphodiesterase (GGDEF & EAL domains) with PAS/PAC sensor [Collimonas arenae]